MIINLFCGGGGSSEGIRAALGKSPDVVIDNDETAIKIHSLNHKSKHHLSDIEKTPLGKICPAGTPVELLWSSPPFATGEDSPDSTAKYIHLAAKAGVLVKADTIVLETVESFHTSPAFTKIVAGFRDSGYAVKTMALNAADFGVPTIKKRLFIVAKKNGEPQEPAPTHSKFGHNLPKWVSAASCIDWGLPIPSIFMGKEHAQSFNARRPLVEATMSRIRDGVLRFVIGKQDDFFVKEYGIKPHIQMMGPARADKSFLDPFSTLTAAGGVGRPPIGIIATIFKAPKKVAGTSDHRKELQKFFNGKLPDIGILDIGMRMLEAEEIAYGQGFPRSYKFAGNKGPMIKVAANATCPAVAAAVVAANVRLGVRPASTPPKNTPITLPPIPRKS